MIWATVSSLSCFCWLYRAYFYECKRNVKQSLNAGPPLSLSRANVLRLTNVIISFWHACLTLITSSPSHIIKQAFISMLICTSHCNSIPLLLILFSLFTGTMNLHLVNFQFISVSSLKKFSTLPGINSSEDTAS